MLKKVTLTTAVVVLSATALLAKEASTSKEAWNGLVTENLKKNPNFKYIENDAKLPNVLLYGDSISIGYTEQVRKELAGKANVYRIHCNGGHSTAFMPRMRQLKSAMRDSNLSDPWKFKWDVIHFNVGLHDLKYISADKKLDKAKGKLVTTPEDYKANLDKIVLFLKKEHPETKIVFATTTPVPAGEPGRHEGDAARYNAIALAVMKQYPEIVINDLYKLSKPNQSKWWSKPGDVHYKGKGRVAQGKQVAEVISAQLK